MAKIIELYQAAQSGDILSKIDKDVLNKCKDTDISRYAVYIQDMWKVLDWLNVNAGIRYDKLDHDIDDKVANESYNPEADAVSPNFGLLFKLTPEIGLFGTVSKAFRLPTEANFCKNPELNPEEAINYEVGAKFFFEKIFAQLSCYRMDVKDKITYDEVSPDTWELRNIGEVRHEGIELSGKVMIMDGLSMTFAGDIIETEILEEPKYPEREGKELDQVPSWKCSLGLEYLTETGFGTRIDFTKVGKWYMDEENTEDYSGDFTTDVKFSWERDMLGYYLKLINIFDEEYCQQAYISSYYGEQYAPALPRTFLAGISLKF